MGLRFALQTCEALLAECQSNAGKHGPSADEELRARAITSVARRHQFLAGRRLAKTMLCDAFGSTPSDWRISVDPHTKPLVLDYPVHISIAHSGDYVACALADEAVGIDLERIKAGRPVADMAQWVCTAQEELGLCGLHGDLAQLQFGRLWTRKEARLKQLGLPFDLAALRAIQTLPSVAEKADGGTWSFSQQGLVVSLAANGLQELHTRWPTQWHADLVQWHRYF